MCRRIIGSILAFMLVFAFLPQKQAQAAEFSDVTKYKQEIEYLAGKGIITGYEDGYFKPNAHLTRLQAVTMILREKGITDYTAADPGFTDLKKGNYGYDRVAKAVELGILSGKTANNGTAYFDAGAPLTRGQMAKILVQGYNLPKTGDVQFKDVSSTNGFKDDISILATEHITTGHLDGTFRPNAKLTREHFAVFMARLLNEDFKTEKNPTPPVTQPNIPDIPSKPDKPTTENPDSTIVSQAERNVLKLTNIEREKVGVPPLQLHPTLQKTAREKSTDMALNNYFSHDSPTYGSAFDHMKANGITYRSAAENIAGGYTTAQAVVEGWMNSPGHRRNMLDGSYTHIGIGHEKSGNYWTQQFIGN